MNKEFDSIKRVIERNDKFIVTAHETPDGDAIGSECAFARALKKMGKRVEILNADPVAKRFSFVDVTNDIKVLLSEDQLPQDINTYVLFILDTRDIHNIGVVADLVLPRVKMHFIVDHHENTSSSVESNVIQMDASSTSEILFLLFKEMRFSVDFEIAQSLFMGIVYDTGSFIYPKTTALTFKLASELVSLGIQPNDIYSRVYETNSVSSLNLQSKILSTLELLYRDQVAVLTMRKQTIVDSRAQYEESDQIINIPLKAENVRVSLFFKENLEELMRCSLRSKGNINVAEIAESFGGGGHKTAAGFKCRQSLEATKQIVLEKLQKYFPNIECYP